MNERGGGPVFAPGMEDALAEEERLNPLGEEAAAAFWRVGAPDVATEDLHYTGAGGQAQGLQIFRGALPAPAPTLVYIHGGGWSSGSIGLNEPACRALAAESGWTVASLSYRLAPAHPYPAGLEDCRAALAFLRKNADGLGLDMTRPALGGASAGANLALAAVLSEDRASVGALVLFYGVFGADTDTPSYRAHAEGPGLTRQRMRDLFDLYDPTGRRHTDPLIAPLLADLVGLPPACLIAADIDVLRCDSEAMADKMSDAGAAVEFATVPGVTHGFINRGRLVPASREALTRAATFLATIAKEKP